MSFFQQQKTNQTSVRITFLFEPWSKRHYVKPRPKRGYEAISREASSRIQSPSVSASRAHVEGLTILYSRSSISERLTLQVREGRINIASPALLVFHKGLKAME